jgi:LysM repeat protein
VRDGVRAQCRGARSIALLLAVVAGAGGGALAGCSQLTGDDAADTTITLPPLTTATTVAATTTTFPTAYVVQEGDTLDGIAEKLGLRLVDLVAANPTINPDVIQPGWIIAVPPPTSIPVTTLDAG